MEDEKYSSEEILAFPIGANFMTVAKKISNIFKSKFLVKSA